MKFVGCQDLASRYHNKFYDIDIVGTTVIPASKVTKPAIKQFFVCILPTVFHLLLMTRFQIVGRSPPLCALYCTLLHFRNITSNSPCCMSFARSHAGTAACSWHTAPRPSSSKNTVATSSCILLVFVLL